MQTIANLVAMFFNWFENIMEMPLLTVNCACFLHLLVVKFKYSLLLVLGFLDDDAITFRVLFRD